MLTDTESVPAAIKRLTDQLHAARATNPPSPLKRMMDETRQRRAQRFPGSDDDQLWMEGGERGEPVRSVEQVRRTRKRKPTLAGVARQATRAGIEVARYEVRPDGTIGVVTGKPAVITDINDTTTTLDPTWN